MNSTNKILALGCTLALCFNVEGDVNAKPGGKGKGGGGMTVLDIEFRCPTSSLPGNRGCGGPDAVQADGPATYSGGTDNVQAFINSAGEELVFNTGKVADPRDVYWNFDNGDDPLGVLLMDPPIYVMNTDDLGANVHSTIIDVGRNANVNIRGLTIGDGPTAIDLWANVNVNFTGRKKDNTVIFPRFEPPQSETGGQRCESGESDGTTFVTIRCSSEAGGACDAWEVWGIDPDTFSDPDGLGPIDPTGDPARACVHAVFPGTAWRGDWTLGPFMFEARKR